MLRVAGLVALLALLWAPTAAAQDPSCFTCQNHACEETTSLGFTNCNNGQECGPEGCLEWCVAGPDKCAEAVPIDPIELRVAGASHCQPAPASEDRAPVACRTRNGAAIGACLLSAA